MEFTHIPHLKIDVSRIGLGTWVLEGGCGAVQMRKMQFLLFILR